MIKSFLAFSCLFILCACTQENLIHIEAKNSAFETKNIIIIVIDGPRYSETWADQSRHLIPKQDSLAKKGSLFKNFYNNGDTYTVSGHTAITTGFYEQMVNSGRELPGHPSIFQLFLKHTQLPPQAASIVTSKGKLSALCNTKDLQWKESYLPSNYTEDRPDSSTFLTALDVLKQDMPKLMLIHFKGPDSNGHAGKWNAYLKSIIETDRYVAELKF